MWSWFNGILIPFENQNPLFSKFLESFISCSFSPWSHELLHSQKMLTLISWVFQLINLWFLWIPESVNPLILAIVNLWFPDSFFPLFPEFLKSQKSWFLRCLHCDFLNPRKHAFTSTSTGMLTFRASEDVQICQFLPLQPPPLLLEFVPGVMFVVHFVGLEGRKLTVIVVGGRGGWYCHRLIFLKEESCF